MEMCPHSLPRLVMQQQQKRRVTDRLWGDALTWSRQTTPESEPDLAEFEFLFAPRETSGKPAGDRSRGEQ